jgi:hypothetical protein
MGPVDDQEDGRGDQPQYRYELTRRTLLLRFSEGHIHSFARPRAPPDMFNLLLSCR